MPSPGGDMRTKLPPLPLEFLQERDVLKEFIYRVNVLGKSYTLLHILTHEFMSLLDHPG